MRSPPYFARIRRSSIRHPRANPTASAAIEVTSAKIHDGRRGITPSEAKRGGGEEGVESAADSGCAVCAGGASAGAADAGGGATSGGAAARAATAASLVATVAATLAALRAVC